MLKVTDIERLKEFGFIRHPKTNDYYFLGECDVRNNYFLFEPYGENISEEALDLLYDLIKAGIVVKE